MREFYVYGFKSRTDYDAKSARSYDNERRRIESWLGDYMRFTKTAEGKTVFLSVDSRVTRKNPFFKAWKTKSFTDGDISLHFAIFDILCSPTVSKSLAELTEEVDERLGSMMEFDESTLRKKLREYTDEGIIVTQKAGNRLMYSRSPDTDISMLSDALDFFSETLPCGVVGSFLRDKLPEKEGYFAFKHHYITQTVDSDILSRLFVAMRKKCFVTVGNIPKDATEPIPVPVVPLRIFISAQNGRQYLIAYAVNADRLVTYRLDYLVSVTEMGVCEKFDEYRELLDKAQEHMWGVNCKRALDSLDRVEFEVYVGEDEPFIVGRLEREKRCGKVEKIDDNHYRFTAYVYDSLEMVPWIRTFISRITRLNFSDRTVENRLRCDIEKMYRMYGITGGDTDAVQ